MLKTDHIHYGQENRERPADGRIKEHSGEFGSSYPSLKYTYPSTWEFNIYPIEIHFILRHMYTKVRYSIVHKSQYLK